MDEKQYYTYIITNKRNTVLYTGVTNNLRRRLYEHRNFMTPGFSRKYRCNKLVYFESSPSVEAAIAREKQIKSGSRKKKIVLIESINPEWVDISVEWD